MASGAEVRMKCPPDKLSEYCEKVQDKFNSKGGKARLVSESCSHASEVGQVTQDEFVAALSSTKNRKLLTSHGLRNFLSTLEVDTEKLSKFRTGFGNANFATSISAVSSFEEQNR